tara:strand:+ start:298412 stop:298903 length:492 start_codon:yes stop_codon:yes gene_type:complete
MNKRIFFSLGALFLLLGCSRDDLCPTETPKTPLLIIRFYNADNPQLLKAAPAFTVVRTSDSIALFEPQSTDSIAIPLDTRVDLTEYVFFANANDSIPDADVISFSYDRKDEFINRACAFRTNFENLDYSQANPTSQSWIESIELINDTVNIRNQNAPHLNIFH